MIEAHHLVAMRPDKTQNVLHVSFTIKAKTVKVMSDCLVSTTFAWSHLKMKRHGMCKKRLDCGIF